MGKSLRTHAHSKFPFLFRLYCGLYRVQNMYWAHKRGLIRFALTTVFIRKDRGYRNRTWLQMVRWRGFLMVGRFAIKRVSRTIVLMFASVVLVSQTFHVFGHVCIFPYVNLICTGCFYSIIWFQLEQKVR